MNYDNREAWLNAATEGLRKQIFEPGDYWLPPTIRVSVGLCGGKAIGLCVDPECAEDKSTHIYIDPKLKEPVDVLQTLLHELVHASVGIECKHRGKFVTVIREIGLDGKATATYASPGTELHTTLTQLGVELGAYPHSALQRKPKEPKPSPWIAYISPSMGEDYLVRANKNTVAEYGPPRDPNGEPMVPKNPEEAEIDEDEQTE